MIIKERMLLLLMHVSKIQIILNSVKDNITCRLELNRGHTLTRTLRLRPEWHHSQIHPSSQYANPGRASTGGCKEIQYELGHLAHSTKTGMKIGGSIEVNSRSRIASFSCVTSMELWSSKTNDRDGIQKTAQHSPVSRPLRPWFCSVIVRRLASYTT